MREILFRGKTKNDNKWIYGDLLNPINTLNNKYSIFEMGGGAIIVIPETVGQFTGLCDKNDKKIFEGDIVLTQPIKDKPYSNNTKTKRRLGKVVWHSGKRENGSFNSEPAFDIEFVDNENKYRCWSWSLFYDCEVIGNIYDNPELLDGEDKND